MLGLLTFLVIIVLVVKFYEDRSISVYFECSEDFESLVIDVLRQSKVKHKITDQLTKATMLVFSDKIILRDEVFFMDWKPEFIQEAVDWILAYLGFESENSRTTAKKPFQTEVVVESGEGLWLMELVPLDFRSVDDYRKDVVKIIITENTKAFENGYLVKPIMITVRQFGLRDVAHFVFDPMSKSLIAESESGGN